MSSVIDELTEDGVALDHAFVAARVRDWARRVDDLYRDIAAWVPELEVDLGRTEVMNEPPMHTRGVAPITLPVLVLKDGQEKVATIVPRGLWVVGTNGRFTMFCRNGQFVIVDRADSFAPPCWEISPALQRSDRHPLTEKTFRRAIE